MAAIAALGALGAAGGGAGALSTIGTVIGGIGSILSAFGGGGQATPQVIMPPAAAVPDVGTPPATPTASTAGDIFSQEEITRSNKMRASLAAKGDGSVNTLTTRFTPINSEQAATSRPTLLGG